MKKLCLLLILIFPLIICGQSTSAKTEALAMSTTGAFFAMSVPNVKESVQWYTEKLGLKVVMEIPKDGKVSVAILEGGGLIVELIQHDDAQPLSKIAPEIKQEILLQGIFKVGIIVDDFEKTLDTLKARNVNFYLGPFPAKEKQRANVLIKDNSGNLIQIFGK